MNIKKLNEEFRKLLEGDVVSFADFKRQKEAEKNLNEAIHIDIKKIKIRWCESAFGNVFFKDGEEMSYEEFQTKVYAADYFLQSYEGYCKCAYTAIIEIQEGPHGEPEETTYDGRVDLGDGQQYVNLMVNMEQVINKTTGKSVFFDNVPVHISQEKIKELAKIYKDPNKKQDDVDKQDIKNNTNNINKDYSNGGTKKPQDVEVGDILYASWGYDMTIVDFYKVIERKPKSVKLQKLEGKRTHDGIVPTETPTADNNVDGKIFRIGSYAVCSIGYKNLYYYNGVPKDYSDWD